MALDFDRPGYNLHIIVESNIKFIQLSKLIKTNAQLIEKKTAGITRFEHNKRQCCLFYHFQEVL